MRGLVVLALLVGCATSGGDGELASTSTGTGTSAGTEVTTSVGASTGLGLAGEGEGCGSMVCDGLLCEVACEEGLICIAHDMQSGCGSALGHCAALPTSCAEDAGPPVCGCDGVVYPSACHAYMVGVPRGEAAGCEAPAGTFPCGLGYCALGVEYCEYTLPHGQLETYLCREPPADCPAADGCGCLPEMPCTNPENIGGWGCELQEGGWMQVVCAPY
jgi:hypothetical protein